MKKRTIGRREMVDFPELDLYAIDAKIDTGAYTSSIHCKDVRHFEKEGREFVSFVLLDTSHPQYDNKHFIWPLHTTTQVKNSFGQSEERYIIRTLITLFDESFTVELSLADRSLMDYPVLLGRKALRKKFIVDVSKKNCSYTRKSK